MGKRKSVAPMGFPDGSAVKNLPANAGDPGSIPGWERSPGEGNGNPPQYSCLENPWSEWPGGLYSPWDHKTIGHYLATKQQQHCLYANPPDLLFLDSAWVKRKLVESLV